MYQLLIDGVNSQEYAEIVEVVGNLKEALDKLKLPQGTVVTLTQGKAKWNKANQNSQKSKGNLSVTVRLPIDITIAANAELDVGSPEDIVEFIMFQLRPNLRRPDND